MSQSHKVKKSQAKLIVALDVDDSREAKRFVDLLYPTVELFKIGHQLFNKYGPDAVKTVTETGARVFLDFKYHDIPSTVFSAVSSATSVSATLTRSSISFSNIEQKIQEVTQLKIFMMTLHTKGGVEMLKAAVKGATEKAAELKIPKPFLVGVTRLTSDRESENTKNEVIEAALLAKEARLDGVVCSVDEAAAVRKECGQDFIIVTPGIRPKDYPADDQKRKATAAEAAEAGANYIVVGRPILKAKDPRKIAEEIIADCKG